MRVDRTPAVTREDLAEYQFQDLIEFGLEQQAEVERYRKALEQIAAGGVAPRADESGWYSVACGVRMLAKKVLDA